MACPSCAAVEAGQTMPPPWRNPQVVTSASSGLMLVIGFIGGKLGLAPLPETGLYLLAVIIGGWYFGREAFETLVKEREIGIELLMSLAAIVAGLMGQWAEAAMLVFLYSISEAAEGYTEERTRHAIRALMDLAPKTALVVRDGKEMRVPVEELVVGDVFIVHPGEAVATDGEIIDGRSSLNQAPVTGESVPVEKAVGDTVFAATLNGEGALSVRVTKTTADNTLARIIQLVEEAQASKGRSQRFIERFGRRYSPAVLGVGVLLALVPGLLGFGWEEWLTRATVFIVAAAPCALVISIPITLVAAIGTAGRKGILVKGGVHLENLARIRVVALDKTGTLTLGQPRVTEIVPLNGGSEADVLGIAAPLEARSQHPLARAVLDRATEQGIEVLPAEDFQSLTGAGATGWVKGAQYFIGSPALFAEKQVDLTEAEARIEALQAAGNTVVVIGTGQAALGLIAIADPLRPEAAEAIAGLKRAGIHKVIMLTGDNPRTAQAIAAQAGIDEVFAELKPEDKTRKVKELDQEYGRVAMVGDGVNDAPALAAAHVGIAMGAAGTDVALETADVALMADDLSRLPYLIRFSRRNWNVIRQNLALSVAVISALIIGAVSGVFSLPIAVLAHEISEFVVIASGLRMLRA
ncbi:cadmium transporter ATPase [Thiohalobacter sp. COW1]|uniref:heavy metal translocating P-type ATPase n=1 Tax=Thiohalobacter sp. COW1 TaxID=2795687 RepID=UPI001916824D|nr:heavy metal translocating P-type ATPase [Thiohalobacter sp. COW1]BCO31297.1 cadmium transporter ATPase [Thiohalobacter sp. COW1]